jgi:hypothetical protein
VPVDQHMHRGRIEGARLLLQRRDRFAIHVWWSFVVSCQRK